MLAETRAVIGNLKGVPERPERGSTKASFMSAAIYVAYSRKTARRVEGSWRWENPSYDDEDDDDELACPASA